MSTSSLRDDLVHACRQVRRHPGHAVVVVLVLSLGFGASTTVSSVASAVLFRPLPVEDPSRLVLFQWTSGPNPPVEYLSGEWGQEPATGRVTASSFSYPAFEALALPGATLAATFGWAELRKASLAWDGEAELIGGQLVSGGYYRGLGVRPHLGRTIAPEDDRGGAELVAVISHGYWQRRFGGVRDVVGRTGTLDGRPITIVGVSERGFSGTLPIGRSADVSVPLLAWRSPGEPYLSNAAWHWLQVMGRLQAEATPAQAEAEMGPRFARASAGAAGDAPVLRLADGRRGLTRLRHEQKRPLAGLAAVTGLALVMACATVAGLLLARGAARRREFGIRVALGAGRGRMLRQLLLESTLLAAAAAVVGLLLALGTRDALAASLMRQGAPVVPLDARALLLAGGTALLTAILSGIVPAWRATRLDLVRDLRDGEGAGARLGLGRALVVAQVALSVVMLVGAGLFLRTLLYLTHVDPGFAAEGVQLFRVHATSPGPGLSRRLLERFQALPGVRAAGVSAYQLLADSTDRTRVAVEGRAPSAAGDEFARVNRVGGDFFEAMGIPIRAGRALGPQDDAGTAPTTVVNESFARAYLPGQPPLGRRVNGAEVVGVAADSRIGDVRDPPQPAMFVPAFQQPVDSLCFQLRTDASPGALPSLVRQAVRAVAPEAAVYDVTSVGQQVDESVSQERLLAGLTSFFGALMLLLASLGLYGLMSFSIRQRTREVGIRKALGARPADVRWMALGSGVRLVAAGTFLGVPTALVLTRVAAGLFHGVRPSDPPTIAAAVSLLFGVTLLACWMPARRAERLDPAVALRHE